jgi:ParB/RepB/Spo0J family partition protein
LEILLSTSIVTPTAIQSLAAQVPGVFMRLPLTALRPSNIPTQVDRRARYDRAALQELADSIKADQVTQPIIVRPIPAESDTSYEIVAGERRWLGSNMAGLAEIPAMVHDLSDEQAARWQLVENFQREGVHPLTEADGFQRLISEHHYTVSRVCAEIGVKEAYVYARLKLLALCPAAKKAFEQNRLTLAHALLIARVPVESLQKQALPQILGGKGMEPLSITETARLLKRSYMLRLADAKFDTADEKLLPAAGPCGSCPKRTGNQPQLFKDVEGEDVCTDPTCFERKRVAWVAQRLAAAKADGRTIIQGSAAKKIAPHGEHHLEGYVRPTDRCHADAKNRTFKQLIGKSLTPALLELPETGELIEVIAQAEVMPVLKERGVGIAQRKGPSDESIRRDKAKRDRAFRCALFDAVRAKSPGELRRRDLDQVAVAFFGRQHFELRKTILRVWGWGVKDKAINSGLEHQKISETQIPKLTEAEVIRFILDCVYAPELQVSPWGESEPSGLLAACERLKIDVQALRAGALQTPASKKKSASSSELPRALRQRMPNVRQKRK